ncbi:MAG: hypothetical protein ACM3X8_02410 [Methanomicrobiales archaeon]
MEEHRRVTEEDLLMTEAMIAESYGRLKMSLERTPSRVLRSASRTIVEHPIAAAGAVTVGGILAYKVLGMLQPRIADEKNGMGRKAGSRPNLAGEIMSAVLPLATPYIARFIGDSLGSILAGGGHTRDRHSR